MRSRPGEHGYGPEELVARLLARPAWHLRAACRGAGTEAFFLHRGQSIAPAKDVCSGCSVASDCLGSALDGDELGVWAGTSHRERRRIVRGEAA